MKKKSLFSKSLILAILLFVGLVPVMAQISEGEPYSRTIRTGNRPAYGDWGIFIGPSFSEITQMLDKDISWRGLPLVNIKYYKDDNMELRLGLQLSKTKDKVKGDLKVNNRRWKKEEENFLVEKWGKMKVSSISKKINRTEGAIKRKAVRLNLGVQMQWYSVNEVAYMFGFSKRKVIFLIQTGKINYLRDKTKKKRYMIDEDSLMKFMKEYQNLWDTRKLTINIYQKKPNWFKEKEISDKNISIKKHNYWSETETKILIDRYHKGWTLESIAEEIGRSKCSVKNKLVKIDYGRKVTF